MTATPYAPKTSGGSPIDVAPDDIPRDVQDTLAEQFSSPRIARIPEPDLTYIYALRDKGIRDLATKREQIANIRKNRYGRTTTPPKLLMTLKQVTRIFSGLSNNEINTVAASLTRNFPEIVIAAESDTQQKFFSAFLQWQDKRNLGGWIRPTVDSQAESSISFWEWYVDPEIEDLEIEQRMDETSAQYKARTGPLFRKAGPILRVRNLDPESCIWDPLAEELKYFLIAERKSSPIVQRELMAALQKKGEAKDEEDPRLPGEYDRGAPYQGGYSFLNGTLDVETIKYYDEKWYCYIVAGKVIECEPHGFSTIPIEMVPGIITGTANPADRTQGIVHTLWANEEMQDTLLTCAVDDALTFGRPKVAITADKDTLAMPPGDDGHVPTVDLTDPTKTPYLPPGYKIQDAYGGFKVDGEHPEQDRLSMFWQRATMNEVSSGSSPGSDVAGYTVNALQTASLTRYSPFITSLQHAIERSIERIVRPYYQRLGVDISIASPNKLEPWITLKVKEIDDTPVVCIISPLADIQKMQITQLLAQLKNSGVLSGYTAAEASPMVADAAMEQKRKDLEFFHQMLLQRAAEDQLQKMYPPAPIQPGAPGSPSPGPGGPLSPGSTTGPPAPPSPGGPALGDARPTNFGQGQQGALPAPPMPPTAPGMGPGQGGAGQVLTAGAMRGGLPHKMGQ